MLQLLSFLLSSVGELFLGTFLAVLVMITCGIAHQACEHVCRNIYTERKQIHPLRLAQRCPSCLFVVWSAHASAFYHLSALHVFCLLFLFVFTSLFQFPCTQLDVAVWSFYTWGIVFTLAECSEFQSYFCGQHLFVSFITLDAICIIQTLYCEVMLGSETGKLSVKFRSDAVGITPVLTSKLSSQRKNIQVTLFSA